MEDSTWNVPGYFFCSSMSIGTSRIRPQCTSGVLVIEMTNHLNPHFVQETSYTKDVFFPPPENHSQEWRYVSRKLPAEPCL